MKISVLGAGAWGTALAMHVANKHQVTLWARNSGHISGMQKARSNPKYLGDFSFPKLLLLDDNLHEAIDGSDIIISAVPTSAFRKLLIEINKLIIMLQLFGQIRALKKIQQNSPMRLLWIF